MAKSQPALLGTQVSGLVLARARGRPGPGLAQSQPALLGTQGSWPKVNRPCWALKGLGLTGPKSTGPVGHSRVGPKSTGPVGHSRVLAPKSTGPVGHSRVLAQSQPALLGTQGSAQSQPALLGTQGSWPKVNRPCWALKGLGPQVDRPCWALKPARVGRPGPGLLNLMAQSRPALLGIEGSRLVLARARGPPWP